MDKFKEEAQKEEKLEEKKDAPDSQGDDAAVDDDSEEEVIVSFGDEDSSEGGGNKNDDVPEDEIKKAPEWVRKIRKENREKDKLVRQLEREKQELESRLVEKNKPKEDLIPLRVKPKLEDHAYDSDAFESDLEKWFSEKNNHESKLKEKHESEEVEKNAWQQKINDYNKRKSEYVVPDYDDAEKDVMAKLSPEQQAVLLKASKQPEKLVYALGRSPNKLDELSKKTDLIDFAVSVAIMETSVKVEKRKPSVPPDRFSSQISVAQNIQDALKHLEDEADRTGNRTHLVAFKKQHNMI
jgi:hypothetical protein